jgi:quinolinate synthase
MIQANRINTEIIDKIDRLKRKNRVIILAHVYQPPDIQYIADYTGDSLELCKIAKKNDADIIVFCGVVFMAETANILSPDKTILLPKISAGCDLSDMASIDELRIIKKRHPEAKVVCYINSSAEIKAESDICCTSANALSIVESITAEEIIFVPDKNLGSYIAKHSNKKIILWDGYCYVHEYILPDAILTQKNKHPNARIIVHPECNKKVRNLADYIGGTAKMCSYVQKSICSEFIVGTEDNFIHHLKKNNPLKTFYPVDTQCFGMRVLTLEDVLRSIEERKINIRVPKSIRTKAYKTIQDMMKQS